MELSAVHFLLQCMENVQKVQSEGLKMLKNTIMWRGDERYSFSEVW